MPHSWIRPNGWVDGPIVLGTEMAALDASLTASINGDGGSNTVPYTPSSPLSIGGAGLWIAGPCLLGGVGDVQMIHNLPPIMFGDNDYFQLLAGHVGASRLIHSPISAAVCLGALWLPESVYYGLADQTTGSTLDVPLKVHQGATLVSATVAFYVGQSHVSIPAVLPAMGVMKVDQYGNATPLATTNVNPNGTVYFPTPPSAAAWYAAGAAQAFVYTCDAGTIIDTTRYSYHAYIVDESGAGALNGNIFTDVKLSFSGIVDARPQ